jgi:TonB family protein
MFEVAKPPNQAATRAWLVVSFLLHATLVALWLYRPPIFVKASSVAWGFHGNSENLVYLPISVKPDEVSEKLKFRRKNRHKHRNEAVRKTIESARAGSENGSFMVGAPSGQQAMPALPIVFPDPDIHPSQLNGLAGDVIIEVTIDEKGNVTNTRVLQSLDGEIDEKVIATLKNWRFKPASVDGIAISSRQDVHFHFPG